MASLHSRLWPLLVDLCATYLAFEVPFDLLFQGPPSAAQRALDIALSLVFAADFWMRFSQLSSVSPATRQSGGEGRFSWGLVGDLVAVIPFRLIAPGTPFELLRLFKVPRVMQDLMHLRYERIEYWTVFRLVFFGYWFTLLVHWLSCGWIAIRGQPPGLDIWTIYNLGLYWCITTLATVGYGDITPHTNIERLYAMGVMIMGVGMYSISIANVAAIVMEMKPAMARHMDQIQRVVSFMRSRRIPIELQHKIRDYFTFIWARQLGNDEAALLAQLPKSLMADVSMVLKRDFIARVPFFRNADEQLLREIAIQMQSAVFAPPDRFKMIDTLT